MGTITLPNFRTTADVTMNTRLKDGGVYIDWTALTDIKAWLYSDAQKAIAGRCTLITNESQPNILVCEYSATKPQYLGVQRLIVQAKYMGRTKTYDKPVFNFVPRTADQEGTQIVIDDPEVDVEIEVEDISSSLIERLIAACIKVTEEARDVVDVGRGPRGYSAYQVAVQNGFEGTEEEWLESLVGPQGEQGVQGEQGIQGETGPAGVTSAEVSVDGTSGEPSAEATVENGVLSIAFSGLKGEPGPQGEQGVQGQTGPAGSTGPQGKSAYQVAVDEGFEGDEEAWLASLVGPQGPQGIQGVQGPQGIQGATGATGETGAQGPQGERGPAGVTSAVVTVENTTGTPSATASVNDGILSIAISGIKGEQGIQGNTGSSVDYPYELVNNRTTNDATKGLSAAEGYRLGQDLSQLEAEVDENREELDNINPKITGRIGMDAQNEDITPTDLLEYTGQYGEITFYAAQDSFLWVCLEQSDFHIFSCGVEVPMTYVKESNGLHCFVSTEKMKPGTLRFKVDIIHPIKSNSERVVITARSYTITYGDEIPEFGWTADGEVVGEPSITCSAVQGSDAGTYEIVIARGTVESDNCVYENGVLTIAKAELTVTADDKFVALNGQMPNFSVQYSGFVLDEDETDLTTLPTCTTDAEDTATAGIYTITPSGGVSGNYSFIYVPGELSIGIMALMSYTSAEMQAGKSIGGYIDTSTNKKKTSSSYYGIVVGVNGFQGCTVKFRPADGKTLIRYAFLKSCSSWSANGTVDFCTGAGQVSVNTETYEEATIPADCNFIYVYTYSNGTLVAPYMDILGEPMTEDYLDLEATLFTPNKTVSATGTISTGSGVPSTWCTTNRLTVGNCTFAHLLRAVVNNIPSPYDQLKMNIAEYTATGTFIKRSDAYFAIPGEQKLTAATTSVHIMMIALINGEVQDIDSVPIDNDDVQLIVKDNS